MALRDRAPVSSGPSRFSSETKSPRKTAPPASTGPASISPPFWGEDLVYLVTPHIGRFVLNLGQRTAVGLEGDP